MIKGGAQLAKGGVKLAKRAKQTAKVAQTAKAPPVAAVAKASGMVQHTEVAGDVAKVAQRADGIGEATQQAERAVRGDLKNMIICRKTVTMTAELSDNTIGGTFKHTNNSQVTEFLANIHTTNDTLELTDMLLYPRKSVGNELKNIYRSSAMTESLEAIKEYARSQGFKKVRIHYQRATNSSSAKPGKVFD
ncbi:MAG: hypothetical protein ACX93T_03305 [Bacteroidota bacterium]